MSNSAKKYIPGLGKDFYIDPSHISVRGGAEKYIPGLGKEFKIDIDCIDTKGGAEKYIPGLGKQFSICSSHVEGEITLSAKEGITGKTVEVTITITGGIQPVIAKYSSGTQSASHFDSKGTIVSANKFTVSANGKYTVFAKDSKGRTTIEVIEVKGVTPS